ncbi:MAG: DUF3078 domain-containing protein [Bacteroidales bacterium]|nr:DUF3078 domain-containing protein [Bacteroidales bacterium]
MRTLFTILFILTISALGHSQSETDTLIISKSADTTIRIITFHRIDTLFLNQTVNSVSVELENTDSIKKQNNWKINSRGALSFNQTHFSNWAQGGENSMSGSGDFTSQIIYKKKNFKLINEIKMLFGLLKPEEKNIKKTEDMIDYSTNLGIKYSKNWYYSTELNYKTQFTKGYKYPNDSVFISDFMSPGIITLSLGIKYDPNENLSILMSPASGKLTFVQDQGLADKGSFGVQPAVYVGDSLIEHGSNLNPEFGINAIIKFKKELAKNLDVDSKINLYNNYLDHDRENRWNIDIDWIGSINYNLTDYITTRFAFQMLYDHDTNVPILNEEKEQIGQGPRLQFKQVFGIGLTFKLNA